MSKTTIVWSSKSIPQRVLDVMRRSRRLRPWTLAELAPKVEASPGSTATALRRLYVARRVLRIPLASGGVTVYGYTVARS